MPTGTPYGVKCPKCRRGQWGHGSINKGALKTGVVEMSRLFTSAHKGHGNGGAAFYGHRGQIECRDCGHKWWSTHPRSGRVSWLECTCAMCKRPKVNEEKA